MTSIPVSKQVLWQHHLLLVSEAVPDKNIKKLLKQWKQLKKGQRQIPILSKVFLCRYEE